MTLFILGDVDIDNLKPYITYAATSWADIILMGLNDGKKPEILIDRSGSMSSNHAEILDTVAISRMDVARSIVVAVASILSKRNKGFDLTQIPVKSWGSKVYSHGTLKDFKDYNYGPPQIPCTDGTNHALWYKESDYPLVITDDFSESRGNIGPTPMGPNEFIENYRNFAWCDGDNIIVMDNSSHRDRLRAFHHKIEWDSGQ